MLRAVAKILASSEEESVLCAKIMLDEIILGLEAEQGTSEKIVSKEKTETKPSVETPSMPETKVAPIRSKPVQDNRLIVVDPETHQITKITNYPEDGKIELDGVLMAAKDTIGKTFKKGRFVD